MTLEELIQEFHDWPGCEELTDTQIKALIEHLGFAHLALPNFIQPPKAMYIPPKKVQD